MIPDDLVPADKPWPVVLGIDPGTRRAGFGAVVVAPEGARLLACGIVRPPARGTSSARLGHLATEIEELVVRLRPDHLALESAFSARNVRSALRLGEARGVVLALAGRRGVPVTELAPAQAKKAVLGHGAASKEQVAAMVATILGRRELSQPDDATDALALALACVSRMAHGSLVRRALG